MNTNILPRIKKLSPQLLVSDLEQAIRFYTEKLGFVIDFRYEDFYCGISRDGVSINLKEGSPSLEERATRRKNEDLDITCVVDNITDFYAEVTGGSVDLVQALRTMPYGQEFYVADPDGYLIGFLEPL